MPALVAPAMAQMASFIAALHEGYARDNLRAETPESIAAVEADPEALVDQLLNPPATVVLPDGSVGRRVPETHLWWVEGGAFLGAISVRHPLNELLEQWGGHIGYGVRPSARGRGHASAMLAGMLDDVRAHLPLERVLLTVNDTNTASIRVIERNGGVLADVIPHPWIAGELGRRYWIAL
jgi:predicted acetyltransferase